MKQALKDDMLYFWRLGSHIRSTLSDFRKESYIRLLRYDEKAKAAERVVQEKLKSRPSDCYN